SAWPTSAESRRDPVVMRSSLHVLLFTGLLAGVVASQRTSGFARIAYSDAAGHGHLMHSNGSHDLEWGHHPTGGAYASIAFALPFDVPGAIARDPGLPIRFWVSGF